MAERPYALLAEFREPEPLLGGARKLREAGYRVEIYSPFPLPGMGEAIGFKEHRVPIATLIGGMVGALTGFFMQVGTNLDYPLDVGGRPLVAVPAFMLITFELTILFAVLACVGTMLISDRLPELHHPLFDAERFHLASDDRFFLAILAVEDFDAEKAHAALEDLDPVHITDIRERGAS